MALQLETLVIPVQSRKRLSITRPLSAGEVLKLEVGEEELNVSCPAGKDWSVSVMIDVSETDA